jgi:hypothetical protein
MTWGKLECDRCGHKKSLTSDEPDGCIADLPGVVGACCGHGDREQSYIQFQNGVVVEGFMMGKPTEPYPPLWIENPDLDIPEISEDEIDMVKRHMIEANKQPKPPADGEE